MASAHKNNRGFPRLMWLALIIALSCNFNGCGSGNTDDRIELTLSANIVNADAEGTFLQVKCDGIWEISFSYPDDSDPWLSADPESGTGSKGNVRLIFDRNTAEIPRSAVITATSGTADFSVTLTQKGNIEDGGGGGIHDEIPQWKELPEVGENDNCVFVVHYTDINGKRMRNYSLYYNKNQRMSYWVAYPLHSVYRGSTARKDNWRFDPLVEERFQVNLSSGFGTSSGYDRGHQIPFADRNVNANTAAQTFYSTNATPQRSSFNQYVWEKLETKIRGWITSDTLYVVTGAILQTVGGNEQVSYARDNTAIPNYYFKVIYSGNGSHKAIGFWYDHSVSYPNMVKVDQARSVEWIETHTGFKFFTNLPQEVQDQIKPSFRAQDWGL